MMLILNFRHSASVFQRPYQASDVEEFDSFHLHYHHKTTEQFGFALCSKPANKPEALLSLHV